MKLLNQNGWHCAILSKLKIVYNHQSVYFISIPSQIKTSKNDQADDRNKKKNELKSTIVSFCV